MARISVAYHRNPTTTLPSSDELLNLPLHLGGEGGVQPFDADGIKASAPEVVRERISRLEEALFRTRPFPPPDAPEAKVPKTNLTEDHLEQLLGAGIIEPGDGTEADEVLRSTVCFCVRDGDKGRLRVLLWCRGMNLAAREFLQSDECPPLSLPQVQDVVDAAATETALGLEDLRAAFWQRRVPAEATSRFAFRAHGRAYRFARLPMGSAIACHIFWRRAKLT